MIGVARRRWTLAECTQRLWSFGCMTLAFCAAARADTFASVRYDARTDELVATMIYRGTNPNHTFTLKWDTCPAATDSGTPYEIAADVLDNQWNDAALQPFRKTVRFSLANLACRPARVTLRSAPRFLYTLLVPGSPSDVP